MPTLRKRSTGAFLAAEDDEPTQTGRTLSRFNQQDFHEIRLLLRGDSVVDWHRLALRSEEDVLRLLRVNGFEPDDPDDMRRLEALRTEAVRYLGRSLGLRIDPVVSTELPALALPLIASNRSKHQRHACVLLKVMHIIHHLDARELRTVLPIADGVLFAAVERNVAELFDQLRGGGVPVTEFAWSRKTKESLITKLLVKRETNAARVFDRLRFRLVVERDVDILPTLNLMLRRFIPFNYVVPGQTDNTLVDVAQLERRASKIRPVMVDTSDGRPPTNEFSGKGYQVLNFIADLPVRVDRILANTPDAHLAPPGSVVFVLTEFQVVDRKRAEDNEQGERSHARYKHRQHVRVRERLLRGPPKDEDR
ncbi:TIGR04552 family protein [Paraliomyxa miuraensis]|uniref:TIGR04552 family protein n=1 Tax=Paraliomyxa miuraensis TaxID=376150 RepID=UPI002250652D|nr:TIGR04552 family protein [Paraliomyxa miuraensis]MCX4245535.1 TIGR04552 family protein [Paraliomyxa miuraensis]